MVTSIENIAQFAGTREITLSGWTPDTEFVCRVKRPTLYAMIASGTIPNPLMAVVTDLFSGNPGRISKLPESEMVQGVLKIVRMALVEPTAKQLDEIGASLTDEQVNEIYAYVIGGAAGLERFREGLRAQAGQHDKDAEDAPKPASKCRR